MAINKANLATWMILLGVLFWGATFSFTRQAVGIIDVYSFLSVRFIIASLIIAAIFIRNFKLYTKEIFWKGILLGTILSAGFILQTTGLKYTTASNAGFITGLVVILVPIIVAVINRRLPKFNQILAILLAVAGIALLTLKIGFAVNIGDIWVLLATLALATHLILIARLVKGIEASMFAVTQLLTVGIITGIVGLAVNKEIVVSSSFVVWKAILFCAIFATAYMYTAQAHLQRYITELKAAIIFSFEPLFAAIIAFLYLGELITVKAVIGGLLIFIAMIISEIKMETIKKKFSSRS